MTLPNTGISTSMVAQAIGAGSNDVGTLCNHANVNKWSKYKPIIVGNSAQSANGTLPYNTGMLTKIDTKSKSGQTIYYFVKDNVTNLLYLESNLDANGNPILTLENLKEYTVFRLGDFRQYDHNSKKPSFDEYLPTLLVAAGDNGTGKLTLTIEGSAFEMIKALLQSRHQFDEVDIDRYVFAGTAYSAYDLEGLSFLTASIDAYSSASFDARFPFEAFTSQTLIYDIPYFSSSSTPSIKLYLDKDDALLGAQKTYNFAKQLYVPTYFNKYASDGSKIRMAFRDVPLRPVISGLGTGITVKSSALYCQYENEMGIPPHYSVNLKLDGDLRGDLLIQVKFEVYSIDWATQTIGALLGTTEFTTSCYLPLSASPDVPSNNTDSLYMSDGIYGINNLWFHLTDPLAIDGILAIDKVTNTGLQNYQVINNRINNFAIKPYIEFTRV